MGLLLRWLASALAILAVSGLGLGIRVSGFGVALLAALVLGLANLLVRPLLLILTLPLNFLTLGLFTLVVNGAIYWLVAALVPGFSVRGFGGAILASLLVGILTVVFGWVLRAL